MKTQDFRTFFSLLGVAAFSLISSAGIKFESLELKVLSAGLFVVVVTFSVYRLFRRRETVNWNKALPILLILSCYPLVKILLDEQSFSSRRNITDGFLLVGSYYQLPLIALSVAIAMRFDNERLDRVLVRFAPISFGLAVPLIYINAIGPTRTADFASSYLGYTNLLIPVCVTAMLPTKAYYGVFSIASIFLLALASAVQGSRSYFLVAAYFLIITFLRKMQSTTSGRIAVVLLLMTCGLMIPLLASSGMLDLSEDRFAIIAKLRLPSLLEAISDSIRALDPMILFYWDGNSRSRIIRDAFFDFSSFDFVWGRGCFETYRTFMVRTTIEVGWAQELYRWGAIFVIPSALLHVSSFFRLRQVTHNSDFDVCKALSFLVGIKFLDGFIYGLPTCDVYNLLVYIGIMLPTVKYPR